MGRDGKTHIYRSKKRPSAAQKEHMARLNGSSHQNKENILPLKTMLQQAHKEKQSLKKKVEILERRIRNEKKCTSHTKAVTIKIKDSLLRPLGGISQPL